MVQGFFLFHFWFVCYFNLYDDFTKWKCNVCSKTFANRKIYEKYFGYLYVPFLSFFTPNLRCIVIREKCKIRTKNKIVG